jgi:hypothetical protein
VLLDVQQPLEIAPFHFLRRIVAELFPDRVKDFSRPLNVDFVGHLHAVVAEIRPLGPAWPAEWVAAVLVALANLAVRTLTLLALLRLHYLVHHVAGALAKCFQRAALALDGRLAAALAEFTAGALHFTLRLAKARARLHAHLAETLLQFAELLAERILLGAQVF